MKQLQADRLIEYHRGRKPYTIVSGIDKGESYTPGAGDFLLTIDKRELKDLDQDTDQYDPVYAYNTDLRSARIFRHH